MGKSLTKSLDEVVLHLEYDPVTGLNMPKMESTYLVDKIFPVVNQREELDG